MTVAPFADLPALQQWHRSILLYEYGEPKVSIVCFGAPEFWFKETPIPRRTRRFIEAILSSMRSMPPSPASSPRSPYLTVSLAVFAVRLSLPSTLCSRRRIDSQSDLSRHVSLCCRWLINALQFSRRSRLFPCSHLLPRKRWGCLHMTVRG